MRFRILWNYLFIFDSNVLSLRLQSFSAVFAVRTKQVPVGIAIENGGTRARVLSPTLARGNFLLFP